MIKNLKSQMGFTLIEMLVYIAILVMIISVIVVFGISAVRTGAKIKANAEVLENSRRVMEIMTYEVRKSQSIYSPTSIFDVNPGQLSLEQSASTLAGENIGFIDFFKCGDGLCLKREGADPLNLTSNRIKVTNLIFSQLLNSNSVPSVQVTLKVESVGLSLLPSYRSSLEVTTTVSLRGK